MIYLWVFLSLLQFIDGWTTWHIIRFGGYELDPIMKFFMRIFGTHAALWITKVSLVAVTHYAIVVNNQLPLWVWGGFIGMFGGVVINNILVLRKMGHL